MIAYLFGVFLIPGISANLQSILKLLLQYLDINSEFISGVQNDLKKINANVSRIYETQNEKTVKFHMQELSKVTGTNNFAIAFEKSRVTRFLLDRVTFYLTRLSSGFIILSYDLASDIYLDIWRELNDIERIARRIQRNEGGMSTKDLIELEGRMVKAIDAFKIIRAIREVDGKLSNWQEQRLEELNQEVMTNLNKPLLSALLQETIKPPTEQDIESGVDSDAEVAQFYAALSPIQKKAVSTSVGLSIIRCGRICHVFTQAGKFYLFGFNCGWYWTKA